MLQIHIHAWQPFYDADRDTNNDVSCLNYYTTVQIKTVMIQVTQHDNRKSNTTRSSEQNKP